MDLVAVHRDDPVPGPEAGLRRQGARVDPADGGPHRVVGAHREEDGQEQHREGPAAQGAGGEHEHPAAHRERGERDPGCTRRVVRILSLEAEPASEGDGPDRPALPERTETEERRADPEGEDDGPGAEDARREEVRQLVGRQEHAQGEQREEGSHGMCSAEYQWGGSVDTGD
jgi:hypothetical protein